MFDFIGKLEEIVQSTISEDFKASNIKTYDFNRSLGLAPLISLRRLFDNESAFHEAIGDILVMGEYTEILGGVDSRQLLSLMSDLSLYSESRCLVNKDLLDMTFRKGNLSAVVNGDVINCSNMYDIVKVKSKRVAELFGGISYSEGYHVTGKPIHGDAYIVVDDNLGYLCEYAKANSEAILILINQPYNSYEYNIQYKCFEDRVKRVADINEALKYIGYIHDGIVKV
jgi:hypothetical protein